jgi:hypothetical protein
VERGMHGALDWTSWGKRPARSEKPEKQLLIIDKMISLFVI